MRDQSPSKRGGFTHKCVTLNFSKCLDNFANRLTSVGFMVYLQLVFLDFIQKGFQ